MVAGAGTLNLHGGQAAGSGGSEKPVPLPRIRDDLSLLPGPPLEDGSPTWTLHEPVKNQFFRIGQLEFEILARWHLRDVDQILEGINSETTFTVTEEDVQDLKQFLLMHFLLDPATPENMKRLWAASRRKRQSYIKWLINHYLFIRVPLLHPDNFLTRTLPVFRFLTSRPVLYLFGVIFIIGTFLAMRQWDSFINTFQYFFSFKGILFYTFAIFFAKFIHELGHAYTSKYYGLRIPSMGIAFLVLWPVLYTDCSESWKLKSRTSRMKIVVAGTGSELALAVLATFLWSFLPDGPARSACFIVATTTWISSLFLNLSPFMRFDGYYFLSDLLDVPNLQERSFALGKYYLRKILMGYETPGKESFSPDKERKMVLYAYSTWIYRFILFTTIALLVYHMFFKALGMVLFGVEIVTFVCRPIYMELKKWKEFKGVTGLNKNILCTLAAFIVLAGIVIVPWSSKVELPAVFKSDVYIKIFPPFSARMNEILVKEEQPVKKGDLLFRLDSPRLDHEEKITRAKINVLEAQVKRQGTMSVLLEQSQIMQRQLASAITELEGLKQQKTRLDITAKEDGVIVDFMEELKPGMWVNGKQFLAGLKNTGEAVLEAYVDEEMLSRIRPGDSGRFYMNNRKNAPVGFTVAEIDSTSINVLKEPGLASIYGGDIAVRKDETGELVSHKTHYRILLEPDGEIEMPAQKIYGHVQIKGKRQSLIKKIWIRIYGLFIRESGF